MTTLEVFKTSRDSDRTQVINSMGDLIILCKQSKTVFCDEPGRKSFFGCPAKQVRAIKRPTTQGDRKWAEKYNSNLDTIWYEYEVEWSQAQGEKIPETNLVVRECQSCNSLSDATIYCVAILPNEGRVVSICTTSYWRSDAGTFEAWKKRLQQRFNINTPEAVEVR